MTNLPPFDFLCTKKLIFEKGTHELFVFGNSRHNEILQCLRLWVLNSVPANSVRETCLEGSRTNVNESLGKSQNNKDARYTTVQYWTRWHPLDVPRFLFWFVKPPTAIVHLIERRSSIWGRSSKLGTTMRNRHKKKLEEELERACLENNEPLPKTWARIWALDDHGNGFRQPVPYLKYEIFEFFLRKEIWLITFRALKYHARRTKKVSSQNFVPVSLFFGNFSSLETTFTPIPPWRGIHTCG